MVHFLETVLLSDTGVASAFIDVFSISPLLCTRPVIMTRARDYALLHPDLLSMDLFEVDGRSPL